MSTVSEHVAQTLARHVDNVFGVMGNGNAAFLDGLERATSARFTAVRHEAGAVVAADAYYRSCGRLAAATATYGAGFTNTLTALAEAVQARVPLVLVVGDEPTAGARPWDVDQIALASAVGARTYTVSRADPAVTTTIAIEHALSFGRPAVIAIPYDVGTLDAGELPPATEAGAPSRVAPSSPFAQSTMDEIAAALVAAHRPFLLAGRGAWLADAGPALSRIADLAGAVTGSSALGRGIFERPEFDIGVVGGFGAEGAMALVREADVVVVFGASLNQFTMRFGDLFAPGTAVFQVDVAQSATHEHVAGFVRGDAALVGEAIAERLAASGVTPSGWRETIDVERLGEREQGDHWRRTVGSIPGRSRYASASCFRRTGWSSPTAAISSAGRTCTGRSPRRTVCTWSAPRSRPSASAGRRWPAPRSRNRIPQWCSPPVMAAD